MCHLFKLPLFHSLRLMSFVGRFKQAVASTKSPGLCWAGEGKGQGDCAKMGNLV
jgi:hypothetical protein